MLTLLQRKELLLQLVSFSEKGGGGRRRRRTLSSSRGIRLRRAGHRRKGGMLHMLLISQ